MMMGMIRMVESVLRCMWWMRRTNRISSGSSCSIMMLFTGASGGGFTCRFAVLIGTDVLFGFDSNSSSC